jgi:hypothetical protein
MYESLISNTSDFHLYIFAFDDITAEVLVHLNLDKVTIVTLGEFETTELKEAKKSRSRAEYCWTCSSSIISYVLRNFEAAECTYIDSDLFFYSDPAILITELDQYNKNVLITEHRFSFLPGLYEEKRAGRFCVQFLTFRNEESSLKVLDKWRQQCIDWCYARYEDGKFGDQKYLDEWPDVYDNIHILQHEGGGIAPWNLQDYRFHADLGTVKGITLKTGSAFKVVFYHFQYIKFLANGSYDVGWYLITSIPKKLFYVPYLIKIEAIEARLNELNLNYQRRFTNFRSDGFTDILKKGVKKLLGYNVMRNSDKWHV